MYTKLVYTKLRYTTHGSDANTHWKHYVNNGLGYIVPGPSVIRPTKLYTVCVYMHVHPNLITIFLMMLAYNISYNDLLGKSKFLKKILGKQ